MIAKGLILSKRALFILTLPSLGVVMTTPIESFIMTSFLLAAARNNFIKTLKYSEAFVGIRIFRKSYRNK